VSTASATAILLGDRRRQSAHTKTRTKETIRDLHRSRRRHQQPDSPLAVACRTLHRTVPWVAKPREIAFFNSLEKHETFGGHAKGQTRIFHEAIKMVSRPEPEEHPLRVTRRATFFQSKVPRLP